MSRGFQSSVSAQLHFGLGNKTKVDSVFIDWGNNTTEKLKNVEVNQTVIFNIEGATNFVKKDAMNSRLFKRIIPTDIGINYKQKENIYDDFKLQLLLPQKQSEKSSALAVGDINNDGLDDFFVGNAKGEKGAIYCQSKDGKFIETNQKLFV